MNDVEDHVEKIARDLAVELSEHGAADWRRFVPLARDLHERIDRQFPFLAAMGDEIR